MGFGGPVIKEGLILVISIVTLQNYYGDLGEACGKYPGWVKVPGPFDICHFFTQLTILFTYIETYGFWGSRYQRRSNFSYIDCYTPKLLWWPRWGMWQVPRLGEGTGTFWLFNYFNTIQKYDFRYHKDGPVIQKSITSVMPIVTLQKCVGYSNKIWLNHSEWVKVPGPFHF